MTEPTPREPDHETRTGHRVRVSTSPAAVPSDAESDNNNLDSNLYQHRMIVDDVVDQHLVMLGHALARNALSAAVAAARAAAPPRAA